MAVNLTPQNPQYERAGGKGKYDITPKAHHVEIFGEDPLDTIMT